MLKTAKVGETRVQIARRVENLLGYSGDFSHASWLRDAGGSGTTPVKTVNAATAPDGTQTACRLQLNKGSGTAVTDKSILKTAVAVTNGRGSIYVRAYTGAYNISIGTDNIRSEVNVTTTWQRITHNVDTLAATTFVIGLYGGGSNSDIADILVWHPMFEDTTGASVTTPSDYIDSRTEYNATSLGVQYLATTNGNTVTNNIVTAGVGGTISPTPYLLLEPAATNYFLNASVPATQTIALTAGTYTITVVGSGSITLSDGATGTVTSAAPLTFTTTGSTIFTKTGSLTRVQVEAGSKASSFIPTSGTAASRSADGLYTASSAGTNFDQTNGIILMKFLPNYSEAETSATPILSVGTITASPSPTGYSVTDGTATINSVNTYLTSGTLEYLAICWDAQDAQMAVAASNDGITWNTWHLAAYDGSMVLPTNIEWFRSNPFINKLYSCRMYKTPNKTLHQAQLWVEANAVVEMS